MTTAVILFIFWMVLALGFAAGWIMRGLFPIDRN